MRVVLALSCLVMIGCGGSVVGNPLSSKGAKSFHLVDFSTAPIVYGPSASPLGGQTMLPPMNQAPGVVYVPEDIHRDHERSVQLKLCVAAIQFQHSSQLLVKEAEVSPPAVLTFREVSDFMRDTAVPEMQFDRINLVLKPECNGWSVKMGPFFDGSGPRGSRLFLNEEASVSFFGSGETPKHENILLDMRNVFMALLREWDGSMGSFLFAVASASPDSFRAF